jgi:hypothetical protein
MDLLMENQSKINWINLSSNPSAIDLLMANQSKICWINLSMNPAAMVLLMANRRKIDWDHLSRNPAAIDLLKENRSKISWDQLSRNPAAIDLLKENPGKIRWNQLATSCYWCPYLHKNLLGGDDEDEVGLLQEERARYKDKVYHIELAAEKMREEIDAHCSRMCENAKAQHDESMRRISEAAVARRAERIRQIEMATRMAEAERLARRVGELEAEIEGEVNSRFEEELKRREVKKRLQGRLAELKPVVPAVPSPWEKVSRFEAIQAKLQDAYNIPYELRRNYVALDAAIRRDDSRARQMLMSHTPLALYHRLRKERNAIVHPVRTNGRMPMFPLSGVM